MTSGSDATTSASAATSRVRAVSAPASVARLDAFAAECTKESIGTHEQHAEDDHERDRVLVRGRHVTRANAFEKTEREAAGDRAGEAAEAPQDRCSEAFQAEHDAGVVGGERNRCDQYARDRAEPRSEPEAREQHAVDVNPDELRREPVVRRREHR